MKWQELLADIELLKQSQPLKNIVQAGPILRKIKRSLFVLSADIFKAIQARQEPVDMLNYYLQVLLDQFDAVQMLLNAPEDILSESQQQQVKESLEDGVAAMDIDSAEHSAPSEALPMKKTLTTDQTSIKRNFYALVLGNVAAGMLGEVHVTAPAYMK